MPWRHLQPMRRKRAVAAAWKTGILIERRIPEAGSAGLSRSTDQKLERPAGVQVDANAIQTYGSMLRKCASLSHGKHIHAQMIASGHSGNMFLGISLIQMYGKCGSLKDAKAVFDNCVPERNVFSWNSLLTAYLENGKFREVLRLYKEMCEKRVEPNMLTYIRVLVACSGLRALAEGRAIHARAISAGFTSQVGVGTALLDMYGKCGCLDEAKVVFERMETRTLVSWNAMIACYAQQGHFDEALMIYRRMNSEGLMADVFTLASILGACGLVEGKAVHQRVIGSGLESHVVVGTALVKMYGKLGRLDDAIAAFEKVGDKDVVCWTALITELVDRGWYRQALKLYKQLLAANIEPDTYTFSSIVGACCSPEDLAMGREIHGHITCKGYESNVIVGTSLVNMYGRCRSVEDAKQVFEKIQCRNLVSWNAILSAYDEAGLNDEILELYQKMDLEPDTLIFSRVLAACANLGDVATGKAVHKQIDSSEFRFQLTVQNGLVTMYSRCGSLVDAKRVFDLIPKKDTVSWNAMITASSQYGHTDMTLDLSREMQLDGVEPNEITFTSILHACAHAGLLREGREYFLSISSECVIPEHYHCMIDLLGRLGRMTQAEELIYRMPFEPDVIAWTTLIGACKVHRDTECAARSAEHISVLNPDNSGPYVLLSNICADEVSEEIEELELLP